MKKSCDGLETLSGAIPRLIDTMRKAVNAYRPVIDENMLEENFNAHLLMVWPSPPQVLFCKGDIKVSPTSPARRSAPSTRRSPISSKRWVALRSICPSRKSYPALQNGTADCGVAGIGPGNSAKWWEVTDHLFPLVLGWAPYFSAINIDTWNSLDQPTQAFLTDAFASWKMRCGRMSPRRPSRASTATPASANARRASRPT